jgi:hypothetical protein
VGGSGDAVSLGERFKTFPSSTVPSVRAVRTALLSIATSQTAHPNTRRHVSSTAEHISVLTFIILVAALIQLVEFMATDCTRACKLFSPALPSAYNRTLSLLKTKKYSFDDNTRVDKRGWYVRLICEVDMSGCSNERREWLCLLGTEAVWPTGDTCMVCARVAGSMKIEFPVFLPNIGRFLQTHMTALVKGQYS